VVALRGNHEDALLEFIADHTHGRLWLDYGGMATLHSYGVRIPPGLPANERFPLMSRRLAELMPPDHRDFYRKLALSETIGDYYFVHAGVNPNRAFDAQDPFELTTIRNPFLEWGRPLERMVVHGHSIAEQPQFRPWRIGIDTGAYATGHLTCLVLEGTDQRILAT
jgi:serine/threonine protein phosphatase 1